MSSETTRSERWLCAAAAVLAGLAVALGAWASHAPGLDAVARASIATASSYALVHAIAVLATYHWASNRLAHGARLALLAGALSFVVSITLNRLELLPGANRAAPYGGLLMIGGWLTLAVAVLRRRGPCA